LFPDQYIDIFDVYEDVLDSIFPQYGFHKLVGLWA